MMKLLLVLSAAICAALMVAGCGDLASLNAGSSGFFNDESSSFSMSAGDTIDVTYSFDKADPNERDCAISIAINGANGGSSDEVVTANDHETSQVSMTVKYAGDFVISVAGKNMVYAVSVSKQLAGSRTRRQECPNTAVSVALP